MQFREELTDKTKYTITAYGDGGFRIQDRRVEGAIALSAHELIQVDGDSLESLDQKALSEFLAKIADNIDVFLIGCGAQITVVPVVLQNLLMKYKLSFDQMDSGAACRTYNVLQQEERRVAAIILPVN